MLHVLLDTTALRQDYARRSPAWRVLLRLAASQSVKFHTSEVSRRELITHRELEFDKEISETKSAIKKLDKTCPTTANGQRLLAALAIVSETRSQIAMDCEDWLSEARFDVVAVGPTHGAEVLEAYFSGGPPFSKAKEREDFPDGYIYHAIRDLAPTLPHLHVITGDKNLGKHVAALGNTTVYSSLEDFLESSEVSALARPIQNIDSLRQYVRTADARLPNTPIVREIEAQLGGQTVEDFEEHREATVEGFGYIQNLELADDAEDFGEGVFALSFTATSECSVEFYLDKGEYHSLEPEDTPHTCEDWNDHVYRVVDDYNLRINGRVIFETEEDVLSRKISKPEEWAPILQGASVTVEIESVNIADDDERESLQF